MTETTTSTTTIEVDQFLAHPPARVWQALIDPVQLGTWFMANDFALTVGHVFTFTRPEVNPDFHETDKIRCEVLEIEPEKLLSYSWTDAGYFGELDSKVTWTLHPEGSGTRLILSHVGFDPNDPIQQELRAAMTKGWTWFIGEKLSSQLHAGADDIA